jgi:hypothetical protein
MTQQQLVLVTFGPSVQDFIAGARRIDAIRKSAFGNTAPALGTNVVTLARVMVALAGAVPGPSD